ncbi:MAG: periplasmic heavy metal sensor [Desulfomonile tiedjei]|nr:periplasmic heavy metal sensor [Desulfomonile tiedjei]
MKKAVFIGLFIFSMAINLAVAATVGWHLWLQRGAGMGAGPSAAGTATLTREDFRTIRQMWPREARAQMMEARSRIMEKNLEVLDEIAKHPGDIRAADPKINELHVLKGQIDREAFLRISQTLASLPDEKRQAFALFLKNRTCMGPGMGMGRGPGFGPGGMGCPVQSQ